MSTHYPEGQSSDPLQAPPPPSQYPAAPPFGAPQGYGAYPGADLQRRRTNVMAILGLVFAFVFSPLGIVFSAIGLSQVKKRHEGGKGLAIAGLVLSVLFLLIGLLMVLLVLPAALQAAKQQATAESAQAVASAPVEQAVAPAAQDTHGIVGACTVILPALTKSDSDMAKASTDEEYLQLTATLRGTIEAAAHTSTDPVFVQDVLTLSQDFQKAADLPAGEDTATLQKAFDDDGQAVSDDCAAAGYAG